MNKIISSALMVASTSIGAGMLSMPLNSVGLGFIATSIILILLFIILTITAFYFLEAYEKISKYNNNINNGIVSITEEFYGKFGKIIVTTILILLLYSLNCAYIAGGVDLIYDFFPKIINKNITHIVDSVVFTFIFFIIILLKKKYIFLTNKFIFYIQNIIFICIICILLSKVSLKNLTTLPYNNLFIISTIPIFALSFGFHAVIPSIYQYLNMDIKKTKISIVIGTGIALIIYIIWQIAIIGALNNKIFFQILEKEPNLNGILNAITQITKNKSITGIIRCFELFAIITSFIGVTISIMNFLNDISQKFNIKKLKVKIAILTLLPSLFFVLFYQNGFIFALKHAAIYFSILCILIPCLIINKIIAQNKNYNFKYLIKKTILFLIFLIGLAIIFIPYLIKLKFLPNAINN